MSTNILCIEASTIQNCSVALVSHSEVKFYSSSNPTDNYAAIIAPMIDRLLKMESHIDAIAVSEGPGSYTGLRIGASIAKGLAFGLEKPLITIPTLDLLKEAVLQDVSISCDFIFVVMDAKRENTYYAIYTGDGILVKETSFANILELPFQEYMAKKEKIICVGDVTEKIKALYQNSTSIIFSDITMPRADQMQRIVLEKYTQKQFSDIAYWEPFYLKEFDVKTAPNKVLSRIKRS